MGTPEKWTERALAEIPVGLLDTIYAENAELAKAAYAALKAANRNDSVEVICAELTEELVSLMIEDHWLMGACVGVNMNEAAEDMLKLAEQLTATGAVSVINLEIGAICSEDVMELYQSGVTEPAEIIKQLLNR